MSDYNFETKVLGSVLTLVRRREGKPEQSIEIERDDIPEVCKQMLDAAGVPVTFGKPQPIPWGKD